MVVRALYAGGRIVARFRPGGVSSVPVYQELDARQISATVDRLERRIRERFPEAGLASVCAGLGAVARQTRERTLAIQRPNRVLRGTVALFVVACGVGAVVLFRLVDTGRADDDTLNRLQGLDAGLNLAVLVGGALLFLVTSEDRLKRRRAMSALHELRTILHVVDMHQLTKDPIAVHGPRERRTKSSPERTLTAFELERYLDYCSEMFSLTAKVAALYAQALPDPVVTDAVNDLEQLAANLSQKAWQKISILQSLAPART